MPITTAFVTQYEEFKPVVIYAHENSITVGKKPERENAFTIPRGYLMSTATPKKGRA